MTGYGAHKELSDEVPPQREGAEHRAHKERSDAVPPQRERKGH